MTGPLRILDTERLALRRLALDDAAFMLELLNEPSFLRYIGDRGVRTQDDARRYIQTGPIESYQRFGFGLYRVELKESQQPIGICGLLKRDSLPDVDVGFAFLPRFWSKGYAFESASAVLAHGQDAFGLKRIVAITSPDNVASIQLLEKLGFQFERMARLSREAPEVRLYARAMAKDSEAHPDWNIRPERPEDQAAIHQVNHDAFGQETEARLVDALRRSPAFVPELSLVAVEEGRVLGHILFTRIVLKDGAQRHQALALAPLAVTPDMQERGVGSALVRRGVGDARDLGHRVVIVLGHPEYYPRFGFIPAQPLGITAPFEVRSEAFMVLGLRTDALDGVRGEVEYAPEFNDA